MSGIKTPVEVIGRQVWSGTRPVATGLSSLDAMVIVDTLNLHDEMVKALEQAAEDYIDLANYAAEDDRAGEASAASAARRRILDLLARAKGAKR